MRGICHASSLCRSKLISLALLYRYTTRRPQILNNGTTPLPVPFGSASSTNVSRTLIESSYGTSNLSRRHTYQIFQTLAMAYHLFTLCQMGGSLWLDIYHLHLAHKCIVGTFAIAERIRLLCRSPRGGLSLSQASALLRGFYNRASPSPAV